MAPSVPSPPFFSLDDFFLENGCQMPGNHSNAEGYQISTAVTDNSSQPSDDKVTKMNNLGKKWRQPDVTGKGGALQALLAAPKSTKDLTSNPHDRSSHLSQAPLSSLQSFTHRKQTSVTTENSSRLHDKNGVERTKGRKMAESPSDLLATEADNEAGMPKDQLCNGNLGYMGATLSATATSTRLLAGASGLVTGGSLDTHVQERGQPRGNVSPGPSLHGLEKKLEVLVSEWASLGLGSRTQSHGHLRAQSDTPGVGGGGEDRGTPVRTAGDEGQKRWQADGGGDGSTDVPHEERVGSSGREEEEGCGSESYLLDLKLRSDLGSPAGPPAVAPGADVLEDSGHLCTRCLSLASPPAEPLVEPRLSPSSEGSHEGPESVSGGEESSPDRLLSESGMMGCFGIGLRVGSMKRSRVGVEAGKERRSSGGEKGGGRVSSLMRRMLRVREEGNLPLPHAEVAHHGVAVEAKEAHDWSARVTSLGKSAAERKERFSHAAAQALHQVQAAETVLHVLSRLERLQSAATYAQLGNIIHEFLPLHVLLAKAGQDQGAASVGGQLEAHARGWFVDFVARAMSELNGGGTVLGLQVKLDLVARLKGVQKWAETGRKQWKVQGAEGQYSPKEIDTFLERIHNFIVGLK